MAVFAKFVMRDNGLPIHIAAQHVTQVRLTPEDGETALYLNGKDTPILVEGTIEAALRKLEAANAGLRIVEPEGAELVELRPEPAPSVVELAERRAEPVELVVPPAPAEAKPAPSTEKEPAAASAPSEAKGLTVVSASKSRPKVVKSAPEATPGKAPPRRKATPKSGSTMSFIEAAPAEKPAPAPAPPPQPEARPSVLSGISWFKGGR